MEPDNSSAARLKTAQAFVDAFSSFSETALLSIRTPSCIQHFAPHSVNIPPKTNSDFKGHFAKLRGVMSSFPFTVKEMIDNPTANQVLVWTTASPVWLPEVMESDEKEDWNYTGEYMFLLSFEEGESGGYGEGGNFKRVERIVEFVDSKGTVRLQGLMKKGKEYVARLRDE